MLELWPSPVKLGRIQHCQHSAGRCKTGSLSRHAAMHRYACAIASCIRCTKFCSQVCETLRVLHFHSKAIACRLTSCLFNRSFPGGPSMRATAYTQGLAGAVGPWATSSKPSGSPWRCRHLVCSVCSCPKHSQKPRCRTEYPTMDSAICCAEVTDAALEILGAGCPRLRALWLSCSAHVSGAVLRKVVSSATCLEDFWYELWIIVEGGLLGVVQRGTVIAIPHPLELPMSSYPWVPGWTGFAPGQLVESIRL